MSEPTAQDLVRAVREFLDAYRPVLRSLAARLGWSPGHTRVLCALGCGPPTGLTDLRSRLGIDAGQLSRTVRQLQTAGVVTVRCCPADRRRRTVQLTDVGLCTYRRLDAAYDDAIRRFLGRLPETEQHDLVTAMDTVRGALDSTAQPDVMARRCRR